MLYRKMLVWHRWIRLKAHVWLMLLHVIHRYVRVCDVEYAHVEFQLRRALGSIDFVAVYDLLDDLIRFPPY